MAKLFFPLLLALTLVWDAGTAVAEPEGSTNRPPELNESELPPHAIWLESLDLSLMLTANGKPALGGKAWGDKPIVLDDVIYPHGVATYANSFLRIDLKHSATRFLARFNAEPGFWGEKCRVRISVDGKKAYETEKDYHFRQPKKAYDISVDLTGASEMILMVLGENGANNKARFGGARLLLNPAAAESPVAVPLPEAADAPTNVLWLNSVNPLYISSGETDRPGVCGTPSGAPIFLQGRLFGHGLVVNPKSILCLNLKGQATRFIAEVGLNDDSAGAAVFKVYVDQQLAFASRPQRAGEPRQRIDLDLAGARELRLDVDGVDGADAKSGALAVWGGARLLLSPHLNAADRPEPKGVDQTPMPIATIVDGPEPAIHGPRIVGSSPGKPFFYAVPVTGEKPLNFAVTPLPAGLNLDPATGFITGTLAEPVKVLTTVTVSNARGKASRPLAIVGAPYGMAPTPPMGWNHWNQWAMNITEAKVRAAAEALVAKGFAAHGYRYVNLDEGWAGPRAADGSITPAKGRFGDLRALGDFIHARGLKFGIYSSPGPFCCGRSPGSYDHERQDANTWAAWGVDYLKYDGCSGNGLPDIEKRWKLMRASLDATGRDIVYSCNKYRGEGVQLWRTTGDIRNNWKSLSDCGFKLQVGLEKIAGPGRYNDPDMMVVGDPADLRRGALLTRNEQITHVTLWSMLAAPLLLGCDLTVADPFLVSVTCNDDVLDINQDPLVRPGCCQRRDPPSGQGNDCTEIWTRPLFDGTTAVAFFNRRSEPVTVRVLWRELGLAGPQRVRDCWQRQDRGLFPDGYEVKLETHAAVLLKVGQPGPEVYWPSNPRN